MDYKKFKLNVLSLALTLSLPASIFAATAIDVSHKNASYLQNFVTKQGFSVGNKSALTEKQRRFDFNRTLHLRAQQTYAGFPVWGSTIAVHVAHGEHVRPGISGLASDVNTQNTTMNGTLYQDLDKDLHDAPAYIFNKEQLEKAYHEAENLFQRELGAPFQAKSHKKHLLVYVDEKHKAHWAYYVSMYSEPQGMPTIPTYILDATTLKVYLHWNDMKELGGLSNVNGGGFGGNFKIGKLIYDGDKKMHHLPALHIQRDNKAKICYLKNKDAVVLNFKNRDIEKFRCFKQSQKYNEVYWDADLDFINGGFSPSNDALYAADVVTKLYQTWYNIPVLTHDEAPMPIVMIMHIPDEVGHGFPEQASWNPWRQVMLFGDGRNFFYPLTSIDVTAHEVSHGFTAQNSGLNSSNPQSAGLNEAFSDMAGQAAQVFARGTNDWKIASDIMKKENILALRYMDKPSKDCYGHTVGENCSIDDMDQYNNYLEKHRNDVVIDLEHMQVIDKRQPNAHHSNGIFNRAFYLLATTEGWDVKKAFDVMVQANRFYWVDSTDFADAACGVIQATKDLKFDVKAVTAAFDKVKLNTSECGEVKQRPDDSSADNGDTGDNGDNGDKPDAKQKEKMD